MFIENKVRATKYYTKPYLENIFKEYAENKKKTGANKKEIVGFSFGKQDMRGGFCITEYYADHTANSFGYHKTSAELIASVQGYNQAFFDIKKGK